MNLKKSAKIQVHVGGVYGNRKEAIDRFIKKYKRLGLQLRSRLVIENDHNLYSLRDCMYISRSTGVPVLFDVFHHQCYNNGEASRDAIIAAGKTWRKRDGVLMVDFSTQKKGARKGTHAESLDTRAFTKFINETEGLDFDLMLEIKDKEKSAVAAAAKLKLSN